jgi:hypothetical protein
MKPEWLKDDADFYRNGLNEHDEEVTQNTEKQIFLKIHFVCFSPGKSSHLPSKNHI